MQTYTFNYKEYKKRISKKHNYSFLFITALIIVLIVIAYFIKPDNSKVDKFYFARINTYLTYSEASKMSAEIQSRGGAGYIHFDGRYHVIASFYNNEEDTIIVVNNLKTDYPYASVYSIDVKKFYNIKNFSASQNKSTANSISGCLNIINKMYSLLLQHDKSEININTLTLNLTNLKKDLDDIYNDFASTFKGNKNANIIKAIEVLDEIKTSINTIKNSLDENFKLKYELVSIIFNYSSFLACF